MKRSIIILENGSREEACIAFDKCKEDISNFTKESVSMRGSMKNSKEGWSVVKTIF